MGRVDLRIIMKLMLWELIFIATIDAYNISSGHLVRHRRQLEHILKIRYHDENLVKTVHLKSITGATVASAGIPTENMEYDEVPRPYYMPQLRPIFYHGINMYSAITYFVHTNTLHGVIEHKFYIENLPYDDAYDPNVVARFIHPMSTKLSSNRNKLTPKQLRKPKYGKRKHENSCQPSGSGRRDFAKNYNNTLRRTLYPEILLLVDVSSEIDPQLHYTTRYEREIRYVYSYWNAVDSLFRRLKHTDIKINIAGIFIGRTRNVVRLLMANPDDFHEENSHFYVQKAPALTNLGRFFHNPKTFNRNSYDFLIWMTSAKLTEYRGIHVEGDDIAIAANPAKCGGMRENEQNGMIASRAIIMDNGQYGDYQIAARELAHLMFVSNDDVEVLHDSHWANCLPPDPWSVSSGIMDPLNGCIQDCLLWSYCSEEHFKNYASSDSSCCLLNFPYRTIGVPHPIKLLTVKTQCNCYGAEPDDSMNYGEEICRQILKCKNAVGDYKEIGYPLDGTKYGDGFFDICIDRV